MVKRWQDHCKACHLFRVFLLAVNCVIEEFIEATTMENLQRNYAPEQGWTEDM